MERYNTIICLTCHENKEVLIDTIKNFQHYMPNSLVLINNGIGADLSYLNNHNVYVLENSLSIQGMYHMIPIHIRMADYIKSKNIESDYVLMLSSNQLFIKHNFYNFMKQYKAGYYARKHDQFRPTLNSPADKLFDEKYFKYQSNHDGMFFLYQDFINMMNLFENYRNEQGNGHHEEFLYIAYLLTLYQEEQMAEFSTYNCWPIKFNAWQPRMDMELIKECVCKNMYIAKRVKRDINDDVRIYIRDMEKY